MIGFEYKYVKAIDIINNILLVPKDSVIEYSIITIIFIFFLVSLYYIIPFVNIWREHLQNEKEKKRKKFLLKQIILQKDMEAEIEKELNI
ncbi:hypothetical protein A9Q91_04935 [Candidatus Gracilibacteria bacterium 28_42_T64]|nr:hypothetical protein A9Q91_04935 [Candidatus Gracilibacteria bacterium 28_42_T64]